MSASAWPRHDDEAETGFHRGELGVEVGAVEYDLVGDAVFGQGTDGPVISGPRQDWQRCMDAAPTIVRPLIVRPLLS